MPRKLDSIIRIICSINSLAYCWCTLVYLIFFLWLLYCLEVKTDELLHINASYLAYLVEFNDCGFIISLWCNLYVAEFEKTRLPHTSSFTTLKHCNMPILTSCFTMQKQSENWMCVETLFCQIQSCKYMVPSSCNCTHTCVRDTTCFYSVHGLGSQPLVVLSVITSTIMRE